jgi:hypothetical protein
MTVHESTIAMLQVLALALLILGLIALGHVL